MGNSVDKEEKVWIFSKKKKEKEKRCGCCQQILKNEYWFGNWNYQLGNEKVEFCSKYCYIHWKRQYQENTFYPTLKRSSSEEYINLQFDKNLKNNENNRDLTMKNEVRNKISNENIVDSLGQTTSSSLFDIQIIDSDFGTKSNFSNSEFNYSTGYFCCFPFFKCSSNRNDPEFKSFDFVPKSDLDIFNK